MSTIELIKQLSDAFGPSGFEYDVAKIVKEEMKNFKNLEEDTLRNVRCELPSNKGRYSVMLDSHLDEVGLIIQAVKPNGTMNFLPIGGWAAPSLPSSKFIFKNRDGNLIDCVVASKPVHFMKAEDRNKPQDISNMILDCGALSNDEVNDYYKLGVASVGVPSVKCKYDENKRMFLGKAFDCRIGVAAEIEAMKKLAEMDLQIDVKAAFSSQEEVGHRGVYQNIEKLKPKVAICFEGAPADDTFSDGYMIQSALNKGSMLRHMDITMITNPRFQKFALDIAKKYNIPVQEGVRSGGGTNAAAIHTKDIPTIVIGVPVRYIHSSHCFVTLDDYNSAVDLVVAICKDLSEEIIDSF